MAHEWFAGSFRKASGQAWHGLGDFFEDGVTALGEIYNNGIADIQYEVCPLVIQSSGGDIDSGKHAIVRLPNKFDGQVQEMRVGVKRTTPLSVVELATVLDPISETYPLECAISLRNGGLTIFQCELPEFYVAERAEEQHKAYLMLSQDVTMPKSIYWGVVVTRVVCANTYAVAITENSLMSIRHGNTALNQLKITAEIEKAFIKKLDAEKLFLNKLFTKQLSISDADKIVDKVFEMPKPPRGVKMLGQVKEYNVTLPNEQQEFLEDYANGAAKQYAANRLTAIAKRELTWQNYEKSLGNNDDGSNAYHLFQAVTSTINHGNKEIGVSYRGNEQDKFMSLLFGNRAKELETARVEFAKIVK